MKGSCAHPSWEVNVNVERLKGDTQAGLKPSPQSSKLDFSEKIYDYSQNMYFFFARPNRLKKKIAQKSYYLVQLQFGYSKIFLVRLVVWHSMCAKE